MTDVYREDLAYIHDTAHGDLARAAAARMVRELCASGHPSGPVVDLGCGTGILAREVSAAGFAVIGVDSSAAMIAVARRQAPSATFRVGSFVSAELPPCVGVTAIGEVLNYLADPGNDGQARLALLKRVYDALVPGGLLMFDVAGPDRAVPASPQRTFSEGPDWVVLAETSVNSTRDLLTRRITTFRRIGEFYRRDSERHDLRLLEAADLVRSLESIGFAVETLANYHGDVPLPAGLTAFIARRR